MEAEKYVSEIVKKIKCTRAKRLEIQKQLLSDIAMRREAGESLEQIMDSMGTAGEIAEAFAQNLPEADKKAYKRRKILAITTVIILVLLLLGRYVWWVIPKPEELTDNGKYSQEKVAAEVEKVIEMLNQDDYAALREMADDRMQSALNQETIGTAKDSICADWGQMQSIGYVYTGGIRQKGDLLIATQTNVAYENISVVYTISFDEDMRLSGLYMR